MNGLCDRGWDRLPPLNPRRPSRRPSLSLPCSELRLDSSLWNSSGQTQNCLVYFYDHLHGAFDDNSMLSPPPLESRKLD